MTRRPLHAIGGAFVVVLALAVWRVRGARVLAGAAHGITCRAGEGEGKNELAISGRRG